MFYDYKFNFIMFILTVCVPEQLKNTVISQTALSKTAEIDPYTFKKFMQSYEEFLTFFSNTHFQQYIIISTLL